MGTVVAVVLGLVCFFALESWLGEVWAHLLWVVFVLLGMAFFVFNAQWGWAVYMALVACYCVWAAAHEARKTRTAS